MTELLFVLALLLSLMLLARKVLRWFSAMFRRRNPRPPIARMTFPQVEIRRAKQVPPPPEPELSIEYVDSGVVMQRDIAIIATDLRNENHVRAWCFTRGEERTFRINRIRSALDLRTGREINDLKRYLADATA